MLKTLGSVAGMTSFGGNGAMKQTLPSVGVALFNLGIFWFYYLKENLSGAGLTSIWDKKNAYE